eukprot:5952023-Pyramimonas_sp.AAC.1
MYVTNFDELAKMEAPFGACLRGVVHAALSTGHSRSGEDTKSVNIQDERGAVVKIVAMGKYPEDNSLATGNDVAIYFLKAQKSNDKLASTTLWAFGDAFARVMAEGKAPRP